MFNVQKFIELHLAYCQSLDVSFFVNGLLRRAELTNLPLETLNISGASLSSKNVSDIAKLLRAERKIRLRTLFARSCEGALADKDQLSSAKALSSALASNWSVVIIFCYF